MRVRKMDAGCKMNPATEIKCFKTVASIIDFVTAVLLIHFISLSLAAATDEFEDFLLCRKCGHDVVRYNGLVNIPSALSHRQRNDSIHGNTKVLIQLFKNPQGNHFEVITAAEADVLKVDKAYSEDSWFPGFSWTIAVCPRCGQHLGWIFTSTNDLFKNPERTSFIGLILDKLLHQNYAENLLIIPKSYKS